MAMKPDEETMKEILAAEEEFTGFLNEAIEQMRNPDGSISSLKCVAMISVLLKSAGFHEGILHCNGMVMTGKESRRASIEEVAAIYGLGYDTAQREFLKHGSDVEVLIKQRLIAMQTKVV